MFGDLMGNMQAQQEELQKKLKEIKIELNENGILIEANAAKEILNLNIAENLLSQENKEELEDLLIVKINRVLNMAEEKQAAESAALLNNLLPGGLGGMFGV